MFTLYRCLSLVMCLTRSSFLHIGEVYLELQHRFSSEINRKETCVPH
jgi:hypothetical protein